MKQFTADNLPEIRIDIQAALKAVEDKHGITLKLAAINYNKTNFTSKVEANIIGGETRKEIDYRHRHEMRGLPKLHSLIKMDGEIWEIVGWAKASRKYCVIVSNGSKEMRYTIRSIQNAKVIRNGQ